MTKQLKTKLVELRLEGRKFVSEELCDSKESGRERFCCHSSKGLRNIPHSRESSNRLFKQRGNELYFIPCMSHIEVYEKDTNHFFEEVKLD